MSRRLSLSEFIQDHLKKFNPRMLKEIEVTLEKASHFDKFNKVHELASPLYEDFELKTMIREPTYQSHIFIDFFLDELLKNRSFFSNVFVNYIDSFFTSNSDSSFNEIFSKFLISMSENFNKIEWMDPDISVKRNPLIKKIPNVFSELILKNYFLFLCFNKNDEADMDPNISKYSPPHNKKVFSYRDMLIYNYNEIFQTEILLLYLIKQYFRPLPLGFSKSESEKFQIEVINPHKKNLFDFLQKLISKRPEDFQEESIGYKIFTIFAKFLKTQENDFIVFQLNKTLKRVLRQYKFPCLEIDGLNYGQNKRDVVELFYTTKFNDCSPEEIVKNLTIIDLKMLFKFNKNTHNKIGKKNEERYNFFNNFLVINVILNPRLKKQYNIVENYYKIADILYREKNYSSLLMYFTCLSRLDLILPKTMKNLNQTQKNHLKESTFFGNLLDGSYEQISTKWKNDLDKDYFCIPFLNYYQRHLNFTDYKQKEKHYLDLGKMRKFASCFSEIHEIKNICSKKVSNLVKDFVKNECYYFLKKDYKIIMENVMQNLENITNQDLEVRVLNLADEFEKEIKNYH